MSCTECSRKTEALNSMQKALDNATGTIRALEAARTRDAKTMNALRVQRARERTTGDPDLEAQMQEVFDYWVKACDKDPARTLFTDDRKAAVKWQLTDGQRTVAFLREAIDGAAAHAYVNEKGKRFNDLELICRVKTKNPEDFADRLRPVERSNVTLIAAGQVVKRDVWSRPLDRAVAALRRELGDGAAYAEYRSEDPDDPRYWDVEYWCACPLHPAIGHPMRLRELGYQYGGRLDPQCANGCLPSMILKELRAFEWKRTNAEIQPPPDELVERYARRAA